MRWPSALKFCTLFVQHNLLKCTQFRVDLLSGYEVIAQQVTWPADWKNHSRTKMWDHLKTDISLKCNELDLTNVVRCFCSIICWNVQIYVYSHSGYEVIAQRITTEKPSLTYCLHTVVALEFEKRFAHQPWWRAPHLPPLGAPILFLSRVPLNLRPSQRVSHDAQCGMLLLDKFERFRSLPLHVNRVYCYTALFHL